MRNVIALLGLLLLCAISFIACNDDDETCSGIVTSINVSINGVPDYTTNFTYDAQNRIVKIVEADLASEDVGESIFSYQADKVIVEERFSREDTSIYTFELKEGVIQKYNEVVKGEDDEPSVGEFTYKNNELETFTTGSGNRITYTWSDGNIIDVKGSYEDRNFSGTVTEFANNANVDFNLFVSDMFDEYTIMLASYTGALGRKCKNVVIEKNADVTVDVKDGYVVKITETGKREIEGKETDVTVTMTINYK